MATSSKDSSRAAGGRRTARVPAKRPAATKTKPHAAAHAASSRTLVAHFQEQLSTRPDRPALYTRGPVEWEARTWGQFGAAARRLSAMLLREGVEPQQHVAIWSNNRAEWHITDMAIMQVRARPVPVYFTLSAEQGGYVLGHSESRVLFVEDEKVLARVLSIRDELPSLARIVVFADSVADSHDGLVISWSEALDRGDLALADRAHAAELSRRIEAVEPSDIATLIYTSGTTGPPKAVTLTHRNIVTCDDALSAFIDGHADQRALSYLPLAHIAERMVSEFRSYIYGSPTYFLDGLEHLGERLTEVRPTQFFGVPRVWEKMAQRIRNTISESPRPRRLLAEWALDIGDRCARERARGAPVGGWLRQQHRLADHLVLSKMRAALGLDLATILVSGAAPISPDVLAYFRGMGLDICEVYGQTEDCAITTMNRPGLAKLGTVGTQLPGIEVKLAEDGEILVRGGNVFDGYYKDDAATAETLIEGWLHTGDVGEFDPEGYLRITDRKKDLIITAGGKNISPSNIESLLKQLPLVAHAVAIGDRRPFVTAVMTLDGEEVSRFAQAHGLPKDLTALASDASVKAEIDAHVSRINEQLNHVEQVKKWTLLPRDFTVGDELTPTLKVKRKVVVEKYSAEIEALYRK